MQFLMHRRIVQALACATLNAWEIAAKRSPRAALNEWETPARRSHVHVRMRKELPLDGRMCNSKCAGNCRQTVAHAILNGQNENAQKVRPRQAHVQV